MAKKFFERPEIKEQLRQVKNKLDGLYERENSEKLNLLSQAVNIVANNTETFDSNCQVNIAWIGEGLLGAMDGVIAKDVTAQKIDHFYSLLYRFVVELDLTTKTDLSLELRRFQNYILEDKAAFTDEANRMALYARQEMPISVVKHLLGSDVIQNLRSLEIFSKDVDTKIEKWEGRITYQESAAAKLESSLKEYKTGFNFVGLHQGFDELSVAKKGEIDATRKWLLAFGLFALLPLTFELILIYFNRDVLDELKWLFLVSAIPVISLTLLAIYFFRIVLRNADAARSQLLQIELRKTLCRFIQSYAEYSKQLKENNIDALGKFESIIFAGLVSSDEKLPSTFDGLEQIAAVIKAIKGEK